MGDGSDEGSGEEASSQSGEESESGSGSSQSEEDGEEESGGDGEEDEEEEGEPVLKYKRFAKEVVASICDSSVSGGNVYICCIAVHSKVGARSHNY